MEITRSKIALLKSQSLDMPSSCCGALMCQYSSLFSNFQCHHAARSSQATLNRWHKKESPPSLLPGKWSVLVDLLCPEGWQLSPALPLVCPPGASCGLGRAGSRRLEVLWLTTAVQQVNVLQPALRTWYFL